MHVLQLCSTARSWLQLSSSVSSHCLASIYVLTGANESCVLTSVTQSHGSCTPRAWHHLRRKQSNLRNICHYQQRTFASSSSHGSVHSSTEPYKVVFLGTPQFAALVLEDIFKAQTSSLHQFKVAAVVSKGHNRIGGSAKKASDKKAAAGLPSCHWQPGMWVSPVLQVALDHGLGPKQMLCPPDAKQEDFLEYMEQLKPDLCITAAYGAILPNRFLDIPRLGTLNIHPSLLPQYRGAAPVIRCLLDGNTTTGVSVVVTVQKCDAGPILAQKSVQIDPNEQAPELTTRLFKEGSQLLLSHMCDDSQFWRRRPEQVATPQDDSKATHAAKVTKEESYLDWSLPAMTLHNKVRAFAGWPEARAKFIAEGPSKGYKSKLEIKILESRVVTHASDIGWVASSENDSHTQHTSGISSDNCTKQKTPSNGCEGQQPPTFQISGNFQPNAANQSGTSSPTEHQQQAMDPSTVYGLSADEDGSIEDAISLPGLRYKLPAGRASLINGRMLVPCGDGAFLEICKVRFSKRDAVGGSNSGNILTGQQLMAGIGKRRLILD